MTYDSNTALALRASRGKKRLQMPYYGDNQPSNPRYYYHLLF